MREITIGGASGFWGDAALATPQLLDSGDNGKLDFLVYDYLAEITMSILARARAADDSKGYATDFVSAAMAPNLARIAAQGVRVIANAGGVNPGACAAALRGLIREAGLSLKVAVVAGDDLGARASDFAGAREMFSGEAFPPLEKVASINAYLGAFPIAAALDKGADIVITGRCVDSAVTLGACIHAFGWSREDYDRLAGGSLAGHILECGTQASGGNFTDWEGVERLDEAGYPLATIAGDGSFEVHKGAGTGGLVSVGTVAEQMLYEIGDPGAYLLPDVACDFTSVQLEQVAEHRVRVSGAAGRGAPDSYKASATWADGFRAGHIWTVYGRDAGARARHFAGGVFRRAAAALEKAGLPPFTETCCEVIGEESHFGGARAVGAVREVDMKLAVRHASPKGIGIFLKEMTGLALTAPPGLTGFAGARAKPSPVVRLFSLRVPKTEVAISVDVEGEVARCDDPLPTEAAAPPPVHEPPEAGPGDTGVEVPLETLAWARSGDKGNKANVGVIARHADFVPYIASALDEARVADCFAHFLAPGQARPVERFYLPGSRAFNYLLHEVLGGGGVASLRSDPQGKGYSQILLAQPVAVPASLAERHQLI
ncbi:acyclic terpene utilization AtuA family protein [Parahaliea mediterranea]|uniref:DUF1446 domain-containing protein n=1 Tax=Parahaliea mediterranea TaxID=651086 RepID=A0A939IJR0_9GAMM|nr:acyclic terpene utilization AtuA family protein [Parahaliea mediterranea]MBN7797939.1 DUF1446 domain-containing protein [Parahaliea mediterranea]